jgi:hypothetical protein
MPCWEVREVTVDLDNCKDHDLLAEALKANGYTNVRREGEVIRFDQGYYRAGRITDTRGRNVDVNAIKRSYSQQVIAKTAKAKGWSAKWTADQRQVVLTKKKF